MPDKIFVCMNYMNDPECRFETSGEEENVIDIAIEHIDSIRHSLDETEFSDEPDSTTVRKQPREKDRWWKKRNKKDSLENKPVRQFVIDENP